MMKNKVSIGLYRKFSKAHPESPSHTKWIESNLSVGDDYPAFGVGVDDANRFAEGLRGRLPSRQQWDKAAGRYDSGEREGPYKGSWAKNSKLQIAIALQRPMTIGKAEDDERTNRSVHPSAGAVCRADSCTTA